MTHINWPRAISGLAILAVAAVAGLISYIHIETMTLALHQPLLIARVYAIGIDGLVITGSVVLFQAPPADRWLGWLGIGPGVAISLSANIMSGVAYGPLAAVWAGIPAVSFALACFLFERFWLHSLTVPAAVPESVPESVPENTGPVPVPVLASVPRRAPGVSPAKLFRAEIARGELPPIRDIKAKAKVGTPKAKLIQNQLREVIAA